MSKRELSPDERRALDASVKKLVDTLLGGPGVNYDGFCDLWAALGLAMHLMPAAGDDPFRQATVATLASHQLMLLSTMRRATRGSPW